MTYDKSAHWFYSCNLKKKIVGNREVLKQAVTGDQDGRVELWLELANNLQDQGQVDTAVEVRAAALVLQALQAAKLSLAQPHPFKKPSVRFMDTDSD